MIRRNKRLAAMLATAGLLSPGVAASIAPRDGQVVSVQQRREAALPDVERDATREERRAHGRAGRYTRGFLGRRAHMIGLARLTYEIADAKARSGRRRS